MIHHQRTFLTLNVITISLAGPLEKLTILKGEWIATDMYNFSTENTLKEQKSYTVKPQLM